jgi:hypothetical protein
MVSSTLEPFEKDTMFFAPEFSPTVKVNVSVFISSDVLAAIVVGTDVVSVVDVPPHEVNAKTATAARANFFISSFFQNQLNAEQ